MSSTTRLSRRSLLFGAGADAPRSIVQHPTVAALRDDATTRWLADIAASHCLNAQGVVCASCADACPHRAILIPIRERAAIHVVADLCDGCSDCVGVCPAQAIVMHPSPLEPA